MFHPVVSGFCVCVRVCVCVCVSVQVSDPLRRISSIRHWNR